MMPHDLGMKLIVSACLALPAGACGGTQARPPSAGASAVVEPQWQEALGAHPRLLLTLHPKILLKDPVYGPLLRRVLDLARQQSRAVASTRLVEAIEQSDEVVTGVLADEGAAPQPSTAGAPAEPGIAPGQEPIVAVLRGMPAELDPAKLVDADGNLLWVPGPSGLVRELVHEVDKDGTRNPASLFELSGRTWVIVSAPARGRVREVFSRPTGQAPPRVDADAEALAALRIDGPALVARTRPLSAGMLRAVGHELQSVALSLSPGATREVRAVLQYQGTASSAAAAQKLTQVMQALSRGNSPALAWLNSVVVEPSKDAVVLKATVPPEILDLLK
ncbi:MAG TPA: hypothetical protein VGY54_22920 [Polyangiaceae bacterium]|jgi:hypothetical protein|nr:hypothetical protein [Polyangiaceae bacterium]